jgi:hypothetical protein
MILPNSLIFIMLFPIVTFASNQTLYYEPKAIEVTGVIKKLKFPGPPNYTSIKNGDAAEIGSYLLLDKPVDIEADPEMGKDNEKQPEKNVSLVQLVVTNQHNLDKIREGNKVRVTGTLFHAITGHHHTRVLINLNKIVILSHQSSNNKLQITPQDKQFLKHQGYE